MHDLGENVRVLTELLENNKTPGVMKMLNTRGESTYPYRSPWFTSNGFAHEPSLDRKHAFILWWSSRITVIIWEAHKDAIAVVTTYSDR